MKKICIFLFLFFAVIFMNSCKDNATNNPQQGNYKIFYTYISDEGKIDGLYSINPDGSNKTLLKSNSVIFSKPQKGKMVFIQVNYSAITLFLKVSSTDGTNEVLINSNEDLLRDAEISPKGDKLLYVVMTSLSNYHTSYLHVSNIDGSDDRIIDSTMISQSDDNYIEAAFSPDGNSIAFIDYSESNREYINVCDVNGNNKRRINQSPISIASSFSLQTFDWSPDGKNIVVNNWDEISRDVSITILNVANGTSENIYTVSNYIGKPVWSPNGKYIAFLAGPCNLWIINIDTKIATQLTDLPGKTNDIGTLSPQWSPDGKYIIFEYTINDDGGDMNQGNLTLVEFQTGKVTTLIQEEQVGTAFFGW
ncbi:MAG: PD40 domain-containing protein [Ignavibacteriae bacterium]|nr:PD40 domain-containing protein [Ignavibacteriota bacterium]